ncbi:MAG: universal stress protein [Calothrix sp. C42_A2020_038]|nr:universal stress protein [Calothrix sp. C42_A2020_038]
MLTRLQNTIGRNDLIEQMILAPGFRASVDKIDKPAHSAKFIVGYNSSCKSHTALDIALCIAHQTRLASNMQITVQAVFVVEDYQNNTRNTQNTYSPFTYQPPSEHLYCDLPHALKSITPVLDKPGPHSNSTIFEQADTILWQARSLAEEWQSNFQAYLGFGCVATELKKIVALEDADVLFLGCTSTNHPIIQSLSPDLNCAILGIPNSVE